MATPQQLRLKIGTPFKGYHTSSAFNRSCVVTLDDFFLISLGLAKSRENLGEISFLVHKTELERNREGNMKYLETLTQRGFQASDPIQWEPLLPIHNPPVVNQISMMQTDGVGEMVLLSFSGRALWEYTQEHKSIDKEIPVEVDPIALMRSNVPDQMAVILQIYTKLKPPETDDL